MDGTKHEMRIMDRLGDTKVAWDPKDAVGTDVVRKRFDALKADGWLLYSVKGGGQDGNFMTAFDPEAERIIAAPPMTGG